jgi:transmembrane sensor
MGPPADDPIQRAITDEAARWVAAAEGDALSARDQASFDAWLDADPRHADAFADMQDLWAHMGAVPDTPTLRASLADYPSRHLSERRTSTAGRGRWIGAAVAASIALIIVGVADDWPTRMRADAITATGERRTVNLPDGSSVQLDTQSAVAVEFNEQVRVVRLLRGDAAFTVARDPGRPFTVKAAGGSATALGTRFLVRKDGDRARVTVTEHRVLVACPTPDGARVVVPEGESVACGATGLGEKTPVNVADAAAWTEGVLVFKDRPLSEVVAEIGRYHRGYVGVFGSAQSLRVSGVFRIDDPVAAINQLQQSLGLHSTRLTDRLILISA